MATLLGAMSFAAGVHIVQTREPVCQGKSLSAWLEELNSTSLYTQDTAKAAIRELGTNAVPALRQMLLSRDSRFKLWMIKLTDNQSLLRRHFRTAADRQLMGILGCRALGPLSRPAIPALIGLLNNSGIANEAAYSLTVIDKNIFPLTRAITNENNEVLVRLAAIARLASGHYEENAVLAALRSTLADNNPEISSQAARSLATLKKESGIVVPAAR